MITMDFIHGKYARELRVFSTRICQSEIARIARLKKRIGVSQQVLMSYCINQGLNSIEQEYGNGKKS